MLRASCALQPYFFRAAGINTASTLCRIEMINLVVVSVKARKIREDNMGVLERFVRKCEVEREGSFDPVID